MPLGEKKAGGLQRRAFVKYSRSHEIQLRANARSSGGSSGWLVKKENENSNVKSEKPQNRGINLENDKLSTVVWKKY